MSDSVRSSSTGPMVLIPRLAKQILRRSGDELLRMQLRDLIALTYIRDHDGVPQQDLADIMSMDPNNVVLVLNDMEERGHITRRRDPSDRRRHHVQITPAGLVAAERAEKAQQAIEDDILQSLNPVERATLRALVAQALDSAEPDTRTTT